MRVVGILLIMLGLGGVALATAQAGANVLGDFGYLDVRALGLGIGGLATLTLGALLALRRPNRL
jgi:hypothetical protein